jgi:hypothetical protein
MDGASIKKKKGKKRELDRQTDPIHGLVLSFSN